ncbi:MAG TPA: hypothetical protein DIS79_11275 [Bacteroidetes bacterium]|nr:hypothetical protein [Bacteroidota bacterium]HRK05466.1 carbohydrate binding domain-containing protein [Chlorobiota bacterium]
MQTWSYLRLLTITSAVCVLAVVAVSAQPLVNPYPFSFGPDMEIDTSLVPAIEPAGSSGRITLDGNGHLIDGKGNRIRLAGTTLQWGGQFPDSITGARMARRLRALGINCVRFLAFDVASWSGGSILADGPTTNGLSATQMNILDRFVWQLKREGIYSAFTFGGVWLPREGDGIRQRDSIEWGFRNGYFFDKDVQRIHRNILREFLQHVNSYTNNAYKDEPAVAFIVASEDASIYVQWLYTQNIVRPNQYGVASNGSQHIRLIDSLYHARLRSKGLTTDNAIRTAWGAGPVDGSNKVINGGFEDPFSAAWTLGVNTNDGAQALLQFSDAEKTEGASSGRIRINRLEGPRRSFSIALVQAVPMKRGKRYTWSFQAKTTSQRSSRTMYLYAYNNSYPYNSYGVSREVVITDQWQRFEFPFTSTATDESTGAISFQLGADSGDVFLDDIQFVESPHVALRPGESLANTSIRRLSFFDEDVPPLRAAEEGRFYHDALTSFLDGVRKLVRDTVDSDVLLCPSTRFLHFTEINAARDYDIFSGVDWRQSNQSILSEGNGGPLAAFTQGRPKGKAFIALHVSMAYGPSYQSEMTTFFPAYAGLQDWDGVFFSAFTSSQRYASDRVDSAVVWEIYDKPHILSMLPAATRMVRNGYPSTSQREIVINNVAEAIDNPRLHQNAYSLSLFADGRMPIYRRVVMNPEVAEMESYLPQTDISQLSSGTVDASALNADNEQIFWDATQSRLTVVTPHAVTVSGPLSNEIITIPGFIFEQTSQTAHTTLALTTLTEKPLVESPLVLFTVATPSLNQGAELNADNTLRLWGTGPAQMDGASLRLTYQAPQWDSAWIVPLGANAQPLTNERLLMQRSSTGRFSANIDTKRYGTPWYRLEFGTSTSVHETIDEELVVTPNPVTDDVLITGAGIIEVVNVRGEIIHRLESDGSLRLSLAGTVPGVYGVRRKGAQGAAVQPFIYIGQGVQP